jgi:hypothetical protein
LREPGAGGGAGPFLRWLAGGISDSAGGSVSVHGEDRGERRKKVGTELTVSKLTPGTEIIHLFSLAPGKNYVVVEKNGLGSHVSVVSYDVDEREEFETSAFFGVSIDSFAAPDLNRYINLEQSSKVKERAIGGVSFAKRVLGHRENTGGFFRRSQIWVYGETVHGVRSAGVDCTQDVTTPGVEGPAVCVQFDPTKPNRTLYMIRASTSLEALAGVRWEFARLQTRGALPASVYAKAQAGFLTVAGQGGDVVDDHHVALGVISTGGPLKESYLEMGIGKTDLFVERTRPRLKIDGYLQFPLFGPWAAAHGLTGFAQMTVNSNWQRRGSDSVQSFFGINIDIRSLF